MGVLPALIGPEGFIGCCALVPQHPWEQGQVFSSPALLCPLWPDSSSFRAIAAADLPQWLGDLAAVLAPTINPRASNFALLQRAAVVSQSTGCFGLDTGHRALWAGDS